MSKKQIFGFLKWFFAIGIIFALWRSGKLDLEQILVFVSAPGAFGFCLLMGVLTYLSCFWRWKILLKGQGIDLPFLSCLKLGMLGMFFSTVIPGTVGGDLVKAVYVGRRFPAKKVASISTIFLDRVVGLVAMLLLASVGFAVGFNHISSLTTKTGVLVGSLGAVISVLSLCLLFSLIVFTVFRKKLPSELPQRLRDLPLGNKIEHLYEVVLGYRRAPSALWKAMVLSFFGHIFNLSTMLMVAFTIHGEPPWGSLDYGSFVLACLLGACAMAIPVAPMGLGVGQLAFGTIFFALGAPGQDFGIPIVSGFQITAIVLNLTGAVFFATYKHEVQDAGLSPNMT